MIHGGLPGVVSPTHLTHFARLMSDILINVIHYCTRMIMNALPPIYFTCLEFGNEMKHNSQFISNDIILQVSIIVNSDQYTIAINLLQVQG